MYLQRIALFFFFVFICWGLLPAKTERLRCTWRENPATSMVIGWDQVTGSDPVLYYDISDKGAATGSYSWSARPVRVVVAKGMNNQFVRLQHLQPNTVYYGIIKDSEGFSQKFSFKTAPGSADQRLSIVAGGDSRNYREARQDANRLVGKLRPHVVLFGGDMTAGDTDTEWIEWMDDWQLTIAADGRMTPVLPARGNHEATNQVLVDLFDVKNADAYYALSFGGDLLRVYTLNSMIPAGGAQRDWLERDLKANPGVQWRMAQYHLPMRPHHASKRENEDERKNWAPLFFQHRMNVAIECDAHVVKLTHPIRIDDGPGSEEGFIRDDDYGTVYAGEGCWGAPLRANDDDKSWTRASGSFNQFKWIFVGREGIEMRTIKTDGSDQIGRASCRERV